jgi:hypothetical protein
MARSVSRYEQYWVLMKQNRGIWLELQVPAQYHERIVKALRKRKGKEHNSTINWYPDFEVIRLPKQGLIRIRLPVDLINTI